jgi:transcription elongation factor GreA-like protein
MDNGSNEWAVKYSSIEFFERALGGHGNVLQLVRTRDILFTLNRKRPVDLVKILLVNTYIFGEADFYRARDEFVEANCIVSAGEWNGYTQEAKELGASEGIGLFMPKELIAAIWREEPHKYVAKDRRGNPGYRTRVA